MLISTEEAGKFNLGLLHFILSNPPAMLLDVIARNDLASSLQGSTEGGQIMPIQHFSPSRHFREQRLQKIKEIMERRHTQVDHDEESSPAWDDNELSGDTENPEVFAHDGRLNQDLPRRIPIGIGERPFGEPIVSLESHELIPAETPKRVA